MTAVGITGHQHLPNPAGWTWVSEQVSALLAATEKPLVGITSLAKGADQIFARAVLTSGGRLEVVIPFTGYEDKFTGSDREEFEYLRGRGSRIETIGHIISDTEEQAYFRAGMRVVDLSDVLVAVWDGLPSKGLGGTADVVQYATTRRTPTIHINPIARSITRR